LAELTNTLREAREARGWTQAQLADAIGVSRKTVNTVENGVFVPSTVVALKLARALGQPVEALFSLEEWGSRKGAKE
jgi:putative transcriptional regulator